MNFSSSYRLLFFYGDLMLIHVIICRTEIRAVMQTSGHHEQLSRAPADIHSNDISVKGSSAAYLH